MSAFSQPIVMLDFETTGMSPDYGERITEVAALRICEGHIKERFVSLVNCGVRIPPFITDLTGITQAMVDRAPAAETVVPALLDFIGDDVLAAHNASFDEKFLRAEAGIAGRTCRHRALLCSVKLARRVLPGHPSYSLGNIARDLGLRFSSRAHRAEADAEVAAHLLLRIAAQLDREYGYARIDPMHLVQACQLNAAKARQYLSQLKDKAENAGKD